MFAKLKNLLVKLKHFAITGKEKAVVAFVVSGVGTYLAQNGLTYKDLLTWSVLKAAVVAIAAHAFVYYVSNQG